MERETLIEYVKKVIKENPNLKEEVLGLWELYNDEIEDECSSPQHEAELCYGSIEDLL